MTQHRQKLARTNAVQAKGIQKKGPDSTEAVHQAAESGLSGGGGALPFADRIQDSFGAFDVSGIRAHTGGAAQQANETMGSTAYATGRDIAFRGGPDLFTAAHEAAHVIQQQAGVQLRGGVGEAGDRYEQHADAVAARVVQGQSAEDLLSQFTGAGQEASVQRRPNIQRRPVQFDGERPRPAPPPSRGPVTAGGIDIRRIDPSMIDLLLVSMQATASRRVGTPTFGSEVPASIQGSGVGTAVRAFLSNESNVRRGYFDSAWVDDDGSSRTVNAWDYQMRVVITSIEYIGPTATGATGTHGSTATRGTAGSATDSESTTNTTSVGATATGGATSPSATGGPNGSIAATGSVGQTDTRGSARTEGGSGGETFAREASGFNRFSALLRANYNIAFRPGTTLGMENAQTRAQNFDGQSLFASMTFDYTAL